MSRRDGTSATLRVGSFGEYLARAATLQRRERVYCVARLRCRQRASDDPEIATHEGAQDGCQGTSRAFCDLRNCYTRDIAAYEMHEGACPKKKIVRPKSE